MKKIQVVFAAVAFMLASVAVLANTFTITVTDWKNNTNGASCTGTQVTTTCDVTGTIVQCQKTVSLPEGGTQTFFYSRRSEDDSTNPPTITCLQLKAYSGNQSQLP